MTLRRCSYSSTNHKGDPLRLARPGERSRRRTREAQKRPDESHRSSQAQSNGEIRDQLSGSNTGRLSAKTLGGSRQGCVRIRPSSGMLVRPPEQSTDGVCLVSHSCARPFRRQKKIFFGSRISRHSLEGRPRSIPSRVAAAAAPHLS